MNPVNNCKNCGRPFTGNFCSTCGEKLYTEKDRSVVHLLKEGLHFISHFDGTFLTTLKTVLFKPGKLSVDYCNGIRKKYFKPLSFFLMLIIIYLLFPIYRGLNMGLYSHMKHPLYEKYATAEVTKLIALKGMSFPALADIFHRKGEQASKFLLFILIPVMSGFSMLGVFKKKRPYFDHLIFCTEALSVLILWGFLIFPLFVLGSSYFLPPSLYDTEIYTGLFLGLGYGIFISIAAYRFFGFKIRYSIIYSLLFTLILLNFIQFIYKFILFIIVIELVH